MKRVLLLALATGCGTDHGPTNMQVSVPWTAATGHCSSVSSDLARLGAVLEVSAHSPCQLAINASTLAASGTCEGIAPGLVRPLMIMYTVSAPSGGVAEPVAFHLGYLDLTPATLGGDETASISLANDGVRGRLVRTEADIAALPASSNEHLRYAETWFDDVAAARKYGLDADDDNCSNLDEACNDTLYEANNTACSTQ